MGNEEKNLKECSDIFKKKTGYDFDDYYKKHKPKLIWLLMKFTKDKEVAEDFVQEAFIQSLNKIDLYNNEYAYITWLSRIATNLVIRDYKIRKKSDTLSIDMSFNNESTLTDYIEYDDGQHETHMDDIVATKAELVKTTIEGLPLKYRDVMTMREIDGMSYKDIAYNSKIDCYFDLCNERIKLPRVMDFMYLNIENTGNRYIYITIKHNNIDMIYNIVTPMNNITLTEKDIKWLKHHNDEYIIDSLSSTCKVHYISSTNLSTIKSRIRQGRKLLNKKLSKKFKLFL